MKQILVLFFFFIFYPLYANETASLSISQLAKKLHLYGGQKAIIQWERVFSSQRHLKRYHLDELPVSERLELKKYLIDHAADSEQPIIPGL